MSECEKCKEKEEAISVLNSVIHDLIAENQILKNGEPESKTLSEYLEEHKKMGGT